MKILVLCFLLPLGQVPVYCEDADFIKEFAARLAVLEKADQVQKLEFTKQEERLQQLQKEIERQNIKLSLQEQRIVELEETVLAQQRIINDDVVHGQGHVVSDQVNEVSDEEVGRPNIVSNAVEIHDVQNADDEDISLIKKVSQVSAVGKYFNVSAPVRSARFVAQAPEMVAFHATVDALTHVTKLTIGQTIVFDSVHINLGGGYHSSAGLFLAPTAGIYMFSVSVMLNTNAGYITLELIQNGSVLAETYAYGYGQGSVSVVTQLKVGDEVLVKLHGPNDAMFYGEKLTSFMGVLLIPV